MNGKGIVSTLDAILQWLTRVVAVNTLWILFSLMGLLIGGVFPATVAALGVTRKWLIGEQDVPIWKTFKQSYWQEIVSSNIIGWLLVLMGLLLYWNYRLIASATEAVSIFIPFAFYLVLFFYITIVVWIFPLLAHYNGSWVQHLRNALIIGLTKIHYTIANVIVLVAIVYFSLEYPGIIPFFSISFAALSCMWFSLQVFHKLDNKPSK